MGNPPRSEAEIFDDLAALCTRSGYVHALSYLIFRDSVVTAGEEFKKEDFLKLYDRERLIRTEIVVLIGLWLKSARSSEHPTPSALQEMIESSDKLLAELHAAMLVPAREDFVAALKMHNVDPNVENPLGKAAAMREAVFYSGESAFTFQYLDFARERYANDGEWLVDHFGFAIADACRLLEALIKFLADQMPNRFDELRGLPVQQWTTLPLFCFTLDDAVELSGLPQTTVSRIIDAFSVPLGSKNEGFRDPFAFNEAGILPFVQLDDGRITLFQEYVATEAAYNSPAYWMRKDAAYAPIAAKHRGEFTEKTSYELISRAFPDNTIYRNVLFKTSKSVTAGEADLILVYGKRAFVFQLKSKGLTERARSGNELAITRDFRSAVQNAYDQAVSCADLLKHRVPTFIDDKPVTIPNLDAVDEFYPVCITSENYPSLSFQVGQYLKTVNKNNIERPIIMDVFTLDVVTEFLVTPLYLIDYLAKRSRLFDKIVSSHELVLFGFHLKGNLFVPEEIGMMFVQDDFMVELDLAMAVRRRALPGADTPSGILTRNLDNPLGRILNCANTSDRPEVHRLGELVLNLSSDAWREINKLVRRIISQTQADHGEHDITVPLTEGGVGLTIHSNELPNDLAFRKLVAHSKLRKYVHKANQWFGVCFSPFDEQVRFAVGSTSPWKRRPELEREAAELKARSAKHWVNLTGTRAKPKRNDPCPCGSGTKYKKCCLQ